MKRRVDDKSKKRQDENHVKYWTIAGSDNGQMMNS